MFVRIVSRYLLTRRHSKLRPTFKQPSVLNCALLEKSYCILTSSCRSERLRNLEHWLAWDETTQDLPFSPWIGGTLFIPNIRRFVLKSTVLFGSTYCASLFVCTWNSRSTDPQWLIASLQPSYALQSAATLLREAGLLPKPGFPLISLLKNDPPVLHLVYFSVGFITVIPCRTRLVCVWERKGFWCEVPCLCDSKKKCCEVDYCRLEMMRVDLRCWLWTGRPSDGGGGYLRCRSWVWKGWTSLV